MLAMMLFAAVTMNWFRVKSRWWENVVLLAAVALLFRPDFFMDQLAPEYVARAAFADLRRRARHAVGRSPRARDQGQHDRGRRGDEDGRAATSARRAPTAASGSPTRGSRWRRLGDRVQIVGVKFGSRARKSGFEQGWDVVRIDVPSGRPTAHWFYLPALAAGRARLVVAGTADAGEGRAPMAGATPRIALIHALAHSIAPVNAELDRAWPDCVRMNLLDDSLSADLAASANGLDDAMTARFMALAGYAIGTGVRGILFTCSAFGPCIDAVARRWPAIPVLKPNEAMIADAARMRPAGSVSSRRSRRRSRRCQPSFLKA